eukprot:m.1005686 g.1005686  ORF g.1005686 m.1005686 type:complete len:1063 (+) comp24051_c1_seq17:195-3383(+)
MPRLRQKRRSDTVDKENHVSPAKILPSGKSGGKFWRQKRLRGDIRHGQENVAAESPKKLSISKPLEVEEPVASATEESAARVSCSSAVLDPPRKYYALRDATETDEGMLRFRQGQAVFVRFAPDSELWEGFTGETDRAHGGWFNAEDVSSRMPSGGSSVLLSRTASEQYPPVETGWDGDTTMSRVRSTEPVYDLSCIAPPGSKNTHKEATYTMCNQPSPSRAASTSPQYGGSAKNTAHTDIEYAVSSTPPVYDQLNHDDEKVENMDTAIRHHATQNQTVVYDTEVLPPVTDSASAPPIPARSSPVYVTADRVSEQKNESRLQRRGDTDHTPAATESPMRSALFTPPATPGNAWGEKGTDAHGSPVAKSGVSRPSGSTAPKAPGTAGPATPAVPSSLAVSVTAAQAARAPPPASNGGYLEPRRVDPVAPTSEPAVTRGAATGKHEPSGGTPASWMLAGMAREDVRWWAQHVGPVGGFLVRTPESRPTFLALVLKHAPKKVKNFLIKKDDKGFSLAGYTARTLHGLIAQLSNPRQQALPVALLPGFYLNRKVATMKRRGVATTKTRAPTAGTVDTPPRPAQHQRLDPLDGKDRRHVSPAPAPKPPAPAMTRAGHGATAAQSASRKTSGPTGTRSTPRATTHGGAHSDVVAPAAASPPTESTDNELANTSSTMAAITKCVSGSQLPPPLSSFLSPALNTSTVDDVAKHNVGVYAVASRVGKLSRNSPDPEGVPRLSSVLSPTPAETQLHASERVPDAWKTERCADQRMGAADGEDNTHALDTSPAVPKLHRNVTDITGATATDDPPEDCASAGDAASDEIQIIADVFDQFVRQQKSPTVPQHRFLQSPIFQARRELAPSPAFSGITRGPDVQKHPDVATTAPTRRGPPLVESARAENTSASRHDATASSDGRTAPRNDQPDASDVTMPLAAGTFVKRSASTGEMAAIAQEVERASQAATRHLVVAEFAFKPRNEDELALEIGDEIEVGLHRVMTSQTSACRNRSQCVWSFLRSCSRQVYSTLPVDTPKYTAHCSSARSFKARPMYQCNLQRSWEASKRGIGNVCV